MMNCCARKIKMMISVSMTSSIGVTFRSRETLLVMRDTMGRAR